MPHQQAHEERWASGGSLLGAGCCTPFDNKKTLPVQSLSLRVWRIEGVSKCPVLHLITCRRGKLQPTAPAAQYQLYRPSGSARCILFYTSSSLGLFSLFARIQCDTAVGAGEAPQWPRHFYGQAISAAGAGAM
jgi:hypothetical protein